MLRVRTTTTLIIGRHTIPRNTIGTVMIEHVSGLCRVFFPFQGKFLIDSRYLRPTEPQPAS
jgi:hypothetical protein